VLGRLIKHRRLINEALSTKYHLNHSVYANARADLCVSLGTQENNYTTVGSQSDLISAL